MRSCGPRDVNGLSTHEPTFKYIWVLLDRCQSLAAEAEMVRQNTFALQALVVQKSPIEVRGDEADLEYVASSFGKK